VQARGIDGVLILDVLPTAPPTKPNSAPTRRDENGEIVLGDNHHGKLTITKSTPRTSSFTILADDYKVGQEATLHIQRKGDDKDVKVTWLAVCALDAQGRAFPLASELADSDNAPLMRSRSKRAHQHGNVTDRFRYMTSTRKTKRWLEIMAGLVAKKRFAEWTIVTSVGVPNGHAKRDRREVHSRLVLLLWHLLKWEYQPINGPVPGKHDRSATAESAAAA